MLGSSVIARPARAPAALALSRKMWSEQRFQCANKCLPGELSQGSTYEQPSPQAGLKDAKEPVHTPRLVFAVRRHDPELVGPVAKTPQETKRLSDLDDLHNARTHVSTALFYRGGKDGIDPAVVIRRALGEALVYYYPFAGRLREIEGERLVVDCTGEGVLFVQADADVRLADLEAAGLRPPFACWDQLLFDVVGSSGMLNCPLLLIQVTRLLCGGFVFALRFNHTICDGKGIVQFVNAVSEFARGLPYMAVTPVWSREIIQAFKHGDRELIQVPQAPKPAGDMVLRTFTFGSSDIMSIKNRLPSPLHDMATTFEALASFLWRARTWALEIPPGEDAPLGFPVNLRGASKMRLPKGYYGNATIMSMALVEASTLRGGSLGDAVALVRRAKTAVTTDYIRSMVDEMVLVGRRWIMPANLFILTDTRSLGYDRVDFGWGKPVFAGPAEFVYGASFLIAVKDVYGEDAVSVPVVLPRLAMLRFAAEVEKLS